MIRLTISEIRKIARTNPEDTLDAFYERLCTAQIQKFIRHLQTYENEWSLEVPENEWEKLKEEAGL